MKFRCICCGYKTIEHEDPLWHDICPVCYWENDPVQNSNHDSCNGANRISLNEAIANYKEFGAVMRDFLKYVREPYPNEQ